ncbi:unnamed protein product [Urochloa humidicola]
MAPWSPRPLLALLLLLALLCSHIALCASAEPGKPKAKPKASGGRKALLAASDAGDDGEDAPAAKPAKNAAAAAGKAKKKLAGDGKNQTKVAKPKKSEPAAAAAKAAAKKAAMKADAAAAAKVTKAEKTKVPKLDKAAAKPAKAADSDKPAKIKAADSAKPAKVKADDSSKPAKATGTKAKKPAKTAKSEAAAGKAKKPAFNSTADSTPKPKPAKSGKKAAPVAVAAAADDDAKANATAASEEEETTPVAAGAAEEDVAFAEEAEGTGDLMSEFRGLPARLQETLMPDLARLSHHSKAYLSAANAGIADGVRPILGGRWAAAAASAAPVALLLLPLFMLTALVRRMGPYLPFLHRALLLAQAYLAIYFATLALAAAATGLEPLRFFHAASPAAYAWTQAAQSLGFMGYLVLQMVDLVAVFSGAACPEEDGGGGAAGADAARALGLAQMVVGLAVGLHYYAAVFHRAAAGEAPRANWRVYAVYAACFVVVCACARAERRKKAYLAGGDGAAEEWKKS